MAEKLSLYFYNVTPPPNLVGEPQILDEWYDPAADQLMDDLRALFQTDLQIQRGYLLRLVSPWPEVGLFIASATPTDPEVINRATWIWLSHRGKAPLLVSAAPAEFERRLRERASPFYAAA